jgi:hypothetical protein
MGCYVTNGDSGVAGKFLLGSSNDTAGGHEDENKPISGRVTIGAHGIVGK